MIDINCSKQSQKCFYDFLEFTYLFNDPEVFLDSLIHMPMANHDTLKQSISVNSLLCKTKMNYRKIEKGFWFFSADIDVRQNFILKSAYNNCMPNDYYILTFSVFDCKFRIREEEDINYVNSGWTFSKPQTELNNFFCKNTTGTLFVFAVNKDWANRNLLSGGIFRKKSINYFFNEEKGFFSGPVIKARTREIIIKIQKHLKNQSHNHFNELSFKKHSRMLIVDFFSTFFQSDNIVNSPILNNSDYYNVLKAQKIILDNLYLPFVGINYISREVRLSPTKLKANFKTVFGFSMLQYHKEKNMLLAIQLIQNSDIPIKNIAALTGYENAGRFSRAFKKRFGDLPSTRRSFLM